MELPSFGDPDPPKHFDDKEFKEHVDGVLAETNKHLEAMRAKKALEGVCWEPPTHIIVRHERDSAGLKCERGSL